MTFMKVAPEMQGWGAAVRERNTFIDLVSCGPPDTPLLLERAKTDGLQTDVAATSLAVLEATPTDLETVHSDGGLQELRDSSPICEKNTFLEYALPPLSPLGLRRHSTAPPPGLEEPQASGSPRATAYGGGPDQLDLLGAPPPCMLPLEFGETPDVYNGLMSDLYLQPIAGVRPDQSSSVWQDGSALSNASVTAAEAGPPCRLALEKMETFDVFEPGPPPELVLEKTNTFDRFEPGPPPWLTLEKMETFDDFEAGTLLQAGQPPQLTLENTETFDTFGAAPPPQLTLEKQDTFDNFEPCRLPPETMNTYNPSSASRQAEPFPAGPSYLSLQRIGSPEGPLLSPSSHVDRPRQQIILQDVLLEAAGLPPPPPLAPAPFLDEAKAAPAPPAVAPTEGDASPPGPEDLIPGNLIHKVSGNNTNHVFWVIHGSKLFSTDVRIVSTQFMVDIPGHGPEPFKLTLQPKMVINNKRGGGFKKAKGKGFVMLKCEAPVLDDGSGLAFSVRVGRGSTLQAPRGPVTNNFSEKSLCGLPDGKDEWDFRSLVDESGMLLVYVQIEADASW
eukprot:TRINITY_DN29924_c0_g1_i1.p1 TRINITY_DN29924_c0_g1~~TRINITY_DN29924_c0_g1_i1.p1  ORF type:complete len:559 (-),score=111.05 TRINITY_DN29924_c0_g1_i1:460-2136(-)